MDAARGLVVAKWVDRDSDEEASLATHFRITQKGRAALDRERRKISQVSPPSVFSNRVETIPLDTHDVFISYASEDKPSVVEPLTAALTRRGLDVWVAYRELRLGDNLRQRIDDGLRSSRFGIVILSPHFFSKQWPSAELNGLVALEMSDGRKRILPVCHELEHAQVAQWSPILAGKFTTNWGKGLDVVVEEIVAAVRSPVAQVKPLGDRSISHEPPRGFTCHPAAHGVRSTSGCDLPYGAAAVRPRRGRGMWPRVKVAQRPNPWFRCARSPPRQGRRKRGRTLRGSRRRGAIEPLRRPCRGEKHGQSVSTGSAAVRFAARRFTRGYSPPPLRGDKMWATARLETGATGNTGWNPVPHKPVPQGTPVGNRCHRCKSAGNP
ncbi:TIR domain protein [Phycisphaerae bacterium RAS1]|nr:TIR domain protein [Phycisphaerae bacterium RAS1]